MAVLDRDAGMTEVQGLDTCAKAPVTRVAMVRLVRRGRAMSAMGSSSSSSTSGGGEGRTGSPVAAVRRT